MGPAERVTAAEAGADSRRWQPVCSSRRPPPGSTSAASTVSASWLDSALAPGAWGRYTIAAHAACCGSAEEHGQRQQPVRECMPGIHDTPQASCAAKRRVRAQQAGAGGRA